MRKKLLVLVSSMVLIALAACGGGGSAERDSDPDFIRIGSGPIGSGWYTLTTVIADMYMDHIDDLNVSTIEGESVSNIRSMIEGDVEYSFSYTTAFNDALNGEQAFDEPVDSISSVASLYPAYQAIVTLESKSDINSVEDIVDKHIFLGPRNGDARISFWRVMEEYGITEETVEEAGGQISYGNFNDGTSMLIDGNVDVFVGGGAPAAPALLEIDVTNPIKVIPVDEDVLERVEEKGYGIQKGALPAGTYKNQKEDTPTYFTPTMVTVSNHLSEDFVYNLTKTFWENLDYIAEHEPTRAKDISLDTAFEGLDLDTLHPGAKKYYEEIDVLE